jgi:Histidine kinase-, DNA gyrase B-, and HSP90-like ATPase
MPVDHKTPIHDVDGTPVKRVILSIIADYDLKTGLCELVDNAIDQWSDRKYSGGLTIALDLDIARQVISVRDDAGGVSKDDLYLLISPGRSRNDEAAELIGIFGVGGKRAVIALAEQTEIRTRYRDQQTHEVDITPTWVKSDDWRLPAYAIPDIEPNTTIVSLSYLRSHIIDQDLDNLRVHLGQTYAWFLNKGCVITLNGDGVAPMTFETWAYLADFKPRKATFSVDVKGVGKFSCEVTSGLIRDRVQEENNYGVYFYCNNRLIEKEIKSREVGYFITTESGTPHSDSSLCRTIVRLNGPASGMPWTSNKSGINYSHPVFKAISRPIIDLNAYFTRVSRRLMNEADWRSRVLRHDTGTVEVTPPPVSAGARLILPDLPKDSRPRGTRQKKRNQAQLDDKPWTVGLVEAIDAIDILERSPLETKNRISLILLDSNFEIALKEFIVHRKDLFPVRDFPDTRLATLFKNRTEVIRTVRDAVPISDDLINLANHYYELRNKLTHERATVDVRAEDIRKYRSVVESVLHSLFDLNFE